MRACRAEPFHALRLPLLSFGEEFMVGRRPPMWLLAALFRRGAVGCICGFKSRTRTHIITNGYVNAEEAHTHTKAFSCAARARVYIYFMALRLVRRITQRNARASHKRNENARPIKIHAERGIYLIAKTTLQHTRHTLERVTRLCVYSWLWSVTVCLLRAVYAHPELAMRSLHFVQLTAAHEMHICSI
jgi:hypothetical protein